MGSKTEKPQMKEEKPLNTKIYVQSDIIFPHAPDEEVKINFPKKISETPKTIHHSTLPNIPFFDH